MMADFSKYFPKLLKFEGGYVNDPNDHGGATKYGVTLKVWIANGFDKDNDGDIDKDDVRLLSTDDAKMIAKKLYWDAVKGDEIISQSIAEFVFDWAYNSGTTNVIRKVQKLFGLVDDGIIGSKTLSALNGGDHKTVFELLKARREAFFKAIVDHDPTQEKFLKGWLIRNNSFKFES